jgi:adenine-specific DNA-methyltransferase
LLNSRLYFQWLFHRGKRKGKMLEMMQAPLSEIPIKPLDAAEQQAFISLADSIQTAKQRDAGMDVSALEREIDEAVYALYALTPEEIQLIEASAN